MEKEKKMMESFPQKIHGTQQLGLYHRIEI